MRTVTITKNKEGKISQIEMWHKIKGVWVHCVQTNLDEAVGRMFSDGVMEGEMHND